MKRLLYLSLTVLAFITLILLGCSTARTSGVYNEDLTQEEPYTFTYNGDPEEALSHLNKTLLPRGFSIITEDKYEGGMSYVYEKDLSDDEKFEATELYEYMTSTSADKQKGRLVFVISSTSGGATVQMTPRLTAKTRQNSNHDPSTEVEEIKEVQVPQGHPLPMKYGRMLAQIDGWKLKAPPRSEVFMDEEPTQKPDSRTQTSGQGQQPQAQQKSFTPSQPPPDSTSERDRTSADASSAAETPKPGERPGEGGDDVQWVQETFNDLGHNCGPEDGIMGPKTRSCIRSFQKANNLEVTGKVNQATYLVMLEKVQSESEPEPEPQTEAQKSSNPQPPPQTEPTKKTKPQEQPAPRDRSETQEQSNDPKPDGAPSKKVLREAIVASLEEGEVPRAIHGTLLRPCVNAAIQDVSIRDIGNKQKVESPTRTGTYWPVKALVTGSCTQGVNCGPDHIMGECDTTTFKEAKAEFRIWKDPYGDWKAKVVRK
ncbi:MAG: peptidoglycan-binding protein [Salinibacter sp.]